MPNFSSEALNEVEKALELYTDDVVWEAPGMILLGGGHHHYEGKRALADNYRKLFASMKDIQFQPVQRFATENRVVDDLIVPFEVVKEGNSQFPVGQKVEMRLVHIFEMRDEMISRETAFTMEHAVYRRPNLRRSSSVQRVHRRRSPKVPLIESQQ